MRPYPISIEWPPAGAGRSEPVGRSAARQVRKRLALPDDVRLAVGVERFDYTKGILDGMRAIDEFPDPKPGMERTSSSSCRWRRRRAANSQPTASCRPRRWRWLDEINAALRQRVSPADPSGRSGIMSRTRSSSCSARPTSASCRSLHDGMNLVAKEFVAARDDEQGVLVLSSFAGASRELTEALIVNPYDTRRHGARRSTARCACRPTEQRERMRRDARAGPRSAMSTAGPAKCCSTRPTCESESASSRSRRAGGQPSKFLAALMYAEIRRSPRILMSVVSAAAQGLPLAALIQSRR